MPISKLKYFKFRNENILNFKLASSPKQQHSMMEKAGPQHGLAVWTMVSCLMPSTVAEVRRAHVHSVPGGGSDGGQYSQPSFKLPPFFLKILFIYF